MRCSRKGTTYFTVQSSCTFSLAPLFRFPRPEEPNYTYSTAPFICIHWREVSEPRPTAAYKMYLYIYYESFLNLFGISFVHQEIPNIYTFNGTCEAKPSVSMTIARNRAYFHYTYQSTSQQNSQRLAITYHSTQGLTSRHKSCVHKHNTYIRHHPGREDGNLCIWLVKRWGVINASVVIKHFCNLNGQKKKTWLFKYR